MTARQGPHAQDVAEFREREQGGVVLLRFGSPDDFDRRAGGVVRAQSLRRCIPEDGANVLQDLHGRLAHAAGLNRLERVGHDRGRDVPHRQLAQNRQDIALDRAARLAGVDLRPGRLFLSEPLLRSRAKKDRSRGLRFG